MTHHKDRSFQIADLDRTWWETATKGTKAASPPNTASDNVQCYVVAASLTLFSEADPPFDPRFHPNGYPDAPSCYWSGNNSLRNTETEKRTEKVH